MSYKEDQHGREPFLETNQKVYSSALQPNNKK